MESPVNTTFESLVEVIGKEGALNLCEQYGGATLYIRKSASESTARHWQTFFGEKAQEKLHNFFGGQRCYIPKAPPELLSARNSKIVQLLKNGESLVDVAKEYHLTTRAVSRIYQQYIIAKEA